MPQTDVYINQITVTASAIAQAAATAAELVNTYFDRGYGSGGAHELTNDDLAAAGLVPADIAGFVTLAQQLENFVDNAAVVQADYGATLNTLRRDI